MEPEANSNFREGEPHPMSRGEQILFLLQQDFGYLYDFEFNVAIGCDRGFDDFEARELGMAWITPDLAHHQAKFAIEIDGIQHRLAGAAAEDEGRDALLAGEGWTVLRVPSYEIYDARTLSGVLDRIQRGVFAALLDQDFQRGIPFHLGRSYPISVECSHCGRHRPGHRVGSGSLCIDCLSPLSDDPYRPPQFECDLCGHLMVDPDDAQTWQRQGANAGWFECPIDHLELDGDW